LISILWKCNNTAAWTLAFAPNCKRPGFWRLFRANLMGDVVSNLLPTAGLGGEVAKPYLLRSEVSVSKSLAAVVANKTMELLSGLVFASAGVGIVLYRLPLSKPVYWGLMMAVGIGGAAIVTACLVQRKHPFSRLIGWCDRLGIGRGRLDLKREAMVQVDEGLSAFYRQDRRRFFGCFTLRLGSWILGTSETYFLLQLMGAEVTFLTAMLMIALAVVIDSAFFFVPANVGTFEAGHSYVAFLLGLSPALGLSVALVKRFRRLLWMVAGVMFLVVFEPAKTQNEAGELVVNS
jgi:uncharacterized protein (TIRG00374 family)